MRLFFVRLFFLSMLALNFSFLVADETVVITSAMPVHDRLNIAHRGSSFTHPENTLPAYQQAIRDQATGGECDVYITRDGIVILSHDKTAKRTLGGAERDITEMTFDEFRQLDAGIWKGEQFKGIIAPTLEEYLQILQGTNCHPVVEIKIEGIEQQVLDVIRAQGVIANTTIISFSQNVIKKVRQLQSDISVGFLYSESLKQPPEDEANRLTEELIKLAKELDTSLLDLNHSILSESLVKNLQEVGLHVWCWTVDDPERMKVLLQWGVESITTNRPDLLTELLKTTEPCER